MNTRYVIAIGATIAVMALFFSRNRQTGESLEGASPARAERPARAEPRTVTPPPAAPPRPAAGPAKMPPPAGPRPPELGEELSENVLRQFSGHMKFLGRCLGLGTGTPVGEKTEPTIESLMDQLRPALGESLSQMDDWSQTEIVDPDGTRRRVRVDYDYTEGQEPTRRLSIYKMNRYGMPEIVNLTPDQTDNPNEAYISSLVEGKKVIGDESSARVYFANGEELIFSMRNGNLSNISVTRGVRAFNCQNLDEESSSCSCP